jgi:hypothetical protein
MHLSLDRGSEQQISRVQWKYREVKHIYNYQTPMLNGCNIYYSNKSVSAVGKKLDWYNTHTHGMPYHRNHL